MDYNTLQMFENICKKRFAIYDKKYDRLGRCEVQDESRKSTVEMKSVNHRYLDANIRMPKKVNFFETAIRSLLKQSVQRGKVDILLLMKICLNSRYL